MADGARGAVDGEAVATEAPGLGQLEPEPREPRRPLPRGVPAVERVARHEGGRGGVEEEGLVEGERGALEQPVRQLGPTEVAGRGQRPDIAAVARDARGELDVQVLAIGRLGQADRGVRVRRGPVGDEEPVLEVGRDDAGDGAQRGDGGEQRGVGLDDRVQREVARDAVPDDGHGRVQGKGHVLGGRRGGRGDGSRCGSGPRRACACACVWC